MNHFTIKDIENLSDIKAHTWRIWEQRYNLMIPQRKDSNHRLYSNDNLKEILRISYLYHHGIKISKIAKLSADEIKLMAASDMQEQHTHLFYTNELLEAALDFDEIRFIETYKKMESLLGTEDGIIKVVYPFLDRIGMLWLTDHIIPAQEHFTSNIIRNCLLLAIDRLPPPIQPNKTVVLYTPEKERHELPLLFIQYLLRKNNNQVVYFGSSISLQTLQAYINDHYVTHIHFHQVTLLYISQLAAYVQQLHKAFPHCTIVMSGKEVKRITQKDASLIVIDNINEMLAYARL